MILRRRRSRAAAVLAAVLGGVRLHVLERAKQRAALNPVAGRDDELDPEPDSEPTSEPLAVGRRAGVGRGPARLRARRAAGLGRPSRSSPRAMRGR